MAGVNKSVCLVIPPSTFLLDERVFMTLGILKVAAVLEVAGIDVSVLDLSGISNYEDLIRDYCANSGTVYFGVTATTPQLPAASNIMKVIRSEKPNARVILGGPHVTLVNAAFKRELKLGYTGRASKALTQLERSFDTLVAGDGEEAIFIAIAEDAPKVIDADIPSSNLFLSNAKLTELPLPARHLVDVDSYHYSIDGVRALSMIAQLGCPFACGFCGGRESPFLRRVRTRSSESVVAEMIHLYKSYGTRGFMMYDDELNVNQQMLDLMHLIHQAQDQLATDFRLRGFIKSQLFNDVQAEAMFQAGFRWILVGFESGSPRILDNINKRATRDENTRCLEIARRHNLKVKALMSIGHPGESAETVEQTRSWLLETAPDDFDLTIITTYPGTPYYDYAVPSASIPETWVYKFDKTGDRLFQEEIDYAQVADYYKGDPNGGYHSFVHTDYLTSEELVQLRDDVEKQVRQKLGIPYNVSAPAIRYEHSMGQIGTFPQNILRRANISARNAKQEEPSRFAVHRTVS